MMEIIVPDLHSTGINHLSVCGRITAPDVKLRKWTRKHQEKFYIYQFKVENGLVYCRVGMDVHKDAETQKEYVHLHIDEGTKEAFKKTPVTSRAHAPQTAYILRGDLILSRGHA